MAATQRFLDEGARVAITGRSEDRLGTARAKLDSFDREAVLPVVAASADLEALDAAMALVGERFGQIDVLSPTPGGRAHSGPVHSDGHRSAPPVGAMTAA